MRINHKRDQNRRNKKGRNVETNLCLHVLCLHEQTGKLSSLLLMFVGGLRITLSLNCTRRWQVCVFVCV